MKSPVSGGFKNENVMISIDSYQPIDSINILFDDDGIEEMIRLLNFIKKKGESINLNGGNDLEEIPLTQGYYSIPHAKIVFIKQGDRINVLA